MKLKIDLNNMNEMFINKDKFINSIKMEFKNNEEILNSRIKELSVKLENILLYQSDILDKNEKLEKELSELSMRTENLKNENKENNRREILERKFSIIKYDDKYIARCLQKDILDFQEYTKDQIKKNKIYVENLLKFVQQAVNECIPDYEVKLYGSHATNLCLPYSDLDVVLVNKRTQYSSNYNVLNILYQHILDKQWKKSIKYIESTMIPIIKITATEEYNNMQLDISLQDGKHYGFKCVELVLSFLNEYEVLEPLILALKNLLKNANLNDPYIVLFYNKF